MAIRAKDPMVATVLAATLTSSTTNDPTAVVKESKFGKGINGE
jgi:hypothetical protein